MTIGNEDGCWGSACLIEHLNLKRRGRHTFHPTFEAEICKETPHPPTPPICASFISGCGLRSVVAEGLVT